MQVFVQQLQGFQAPDDNLFFSKNVFFEKLDFSGNFNNHKALITFTEIFANFYFRLCKKFMKFHNNVGSRVAASQ